MPVSSAKNRCFLCFGIIGVICLFSQITMAGESNLLSRISPHISLNNNTPSQELQSFSIHKNHHIDEYLTPGGDYSAPPLKKNLGTQDLFSLALGARFQISDWLGVGAACSMPFTEEENVGTKDMSIEAMVTMQF